MIPSIEAHVNTKLIGTGSDRTPHPLPHLVLLRKWRGDVAEGSLF